MLLFVFLLWEKKRERKMKKVDTNLICFFLAEKSMWDLSYPWQACSNFSQWLLVAFTLYVPSHNQ